MHPSWRGRALLGAVLVALPWLASADNVAARMGEDGWYRWQVEAIEPTPDWCCYSWKSSASRPVACDLDRKNHSFSSSDAISPGAAVMDIYARQQSGRIVDVRAYGPACEVHSKAAIIDLGQLDAASSLALLQEAETGDVDQTLAAISVHAGAGTDVLIGMIEDRSRPFPDRSKALFWLALSGSGEGIDYIQELLTDQ